MSDFQTRLLDPVKTEPYDPTDYAAVRKRIFDNTKNAFAQRFPLENERYVLDVEGLEYSDYEPTLKDEKRAILKNGSVTKKLRGRFKLVNKETGEVKHSNPRIMMNVPYMTRRGTFIRNGGEKSINYMFRLVPGVYSRKKDNGMYEAHVNPKQGTGGQFKIEMDPKTGIFRVRKGTRGYKLYPLLKRSGVTDAQIKDMWGSEILDVNRQASDVQRTQKKFVGGVPKTASDTSAQYDELLEELQKAELDPVATELTLGRPHKKVTPETLLEASAKVLNISRGKADVDYRDSLEFQKIDGPADYFAERIVRDGGGIARNLLWRISKNGSFDDIPTAPMNKHVDAIFNESKHAGFIDGSSPFSGIDLSTKITRIGEGGISGVRTAPSETRAVQDTFAGFIDPVRTVESLRVGLDMYLNHGVRKGDDGRLYTRMLNAKTGKEEWVDSLTAARSTVATKHEFDSKEKYVPAIRGNKGVQVLPKSQIDYFIMDNSRMYSLGANSVPGKGGIMANRLHMGGKYGVQAMPLADREAPLVRSKQGDTTNEEAVGRMFGVNRASEGGRVASVDADKIVVRGLKGTQVYELYDNHPFNQKGYLRSIPKVNVGDEVKPDQVLSTTNYTDDKGVAAQGRNLRVAYMPWKGMNFEDAIAVSATAARKLAAEKMYKKRLPVSSNTSFSKKDFMGKFPSKFTKDQMNTIGNDGVVKPGTVLRKGDPMIVAVRHNDPKPGSMGRKTKTALMETWEKKYEGKVVDTDIGDKHATVYVRANVPMKTGDKLSNRYAAKGVVNVLPDTEMPLDENGKPVDVVLNSLGIISRVNPMQVVETMAGKLARETGKPEVIDGFSDEDMIELYEKKLKEAGLQANEDLYDPQTGRKIPSVLTGEAFFYRMMHMAEDKEGGRGTGSVTGEETPLRGGPHGAKQMGNLHTSALVSHGAMKVLKDAKLVRGQANDDFWRDFRMGRMPKTPGRSLVNQKFYEHLKGAGINVEEDSDRINFFAMTNDQARKLSKGHELKLARTFDQKTMSPVDGGLFDPRLFGQNGNDWAYIQLDEPMPNPVMEQALASTLNMTQKQFNEVMAGEREINGRTGGNAVKAALEKLDMNSAVKDSLVALKSSTPSKKDKALKKYRFLKSMEEQGVHPKDFMMDRIPVLPPKFRPVTQMDGINMTADANIMYRSAMFARDDLRAAKEKLPDNMIKAARKNMYQTYKALTGLYDPDDAKLEEKNVQGLIKWAFGKGSAKRGAYQRRILGTAMNVAGRGVVTPNPALKLNQVGLPIKQAWEVYEPFVVRAMVRNGFPTTEAIRHVKDRTEKAKPHLKEVVENSGRPLIMNRAPSLHKYSVMAFNPILVEGSTVQVSPSIVSPYNMDFDGDTVTYYVPVSKDAVEEARKKMMPEKNLLSPRSFRTQYMSGQEFVQGLYLATRAGKGKPKKTFKTVKDAQDAYNKGEIDIDTPIVIVENK